LTKIFKGKKAKQSQQEDRSVLVGNYDDGEEQN